MGTPSALLWLALDLMGDLVAPARCAACDVPVARLAVFCGACAVTAERPPPGDPEGVPLAAFSYGGAIATAITRLKYEQRPDLARPLGDLLGRALAARHASLAGVVVVPVPLHAGRLAERGFNQSALLARRACARLGGELSPMALVRVRDTPRQANLDRASRLRNVEDAFRARHPERVRGRRVLLVDDVSTTGATLRACARALQAAGAREVSSAVVALAYRGAGAGEVSSPGPGERRQGRQGADSR
jgi:ComF family protein